VIPKDTIDRIIEVARIEEVVGDFVTLRKRGANLLGLCPFHNEKTPSFTVSPAKGIYKCFGCGAAGNSVNFVMQQESLSYPEALKFLANKYAITVEEREITPEEKAQQTERESLFIVAAFAQKHFTQIMNETDEGKSVGLGYFIERGFRKDIIEKFQLGYSSEGRRDFTDAAIRSGYRPDYLIKTGLSLLSSKEQENMQENGTEINPAKMFDRYSGRVIFPIQNVSGRVIGFGGRILSNDKKLAKYINSPQTDIYDKSKVLYGLYLAKKSITQEDNCFLVEGYTDVISLHQAGIENVVSSSGTSLTVDQIRLIHRFTNNITVLYDGDWAGIKASFRGIDLILEQGMNVRVLLFPDNEDPDSYSRKVSPDDLREFIKNNTTDFIRFKTNLLYEEAKSDPIKKAGLIKDIVESISLIPDAISRSVYVKESATLLEMDEQMLGLEVNKIRLKKAGKKPTIETSSSSETPLKPEEELAPTLEEQDQRLAIQISESQEAYLLKLLLQYGDHIITIEAEDDEKNTSEMEVTVGEYLFYELNRDGIEFINPVFQLFAEEYYHQLISNTIPNQKFFIHHTNPAVAQVTINLLANEYKLSENRSKFGIYIEEEKFILKKSLQHALFSLKEKRLMDHIRRKQEELKSAKEEDIDFLLLEMKHLHVMKARVNKLLGRTIVG
jgi:DNA primase